MSARMRLGVLVLGLAGCVSIPPFRGEQASPDAAPSPLAVRLIGNAWRDGGAGGTGTPGMMQELYSIPTTGIVDGDLVVFVANVDNGFQDFWKLPPAFNTIANRKFGGDGQSYAVGWKVAATEPAVYSETYRYAMMTSGAATITLLAVTGYDQENPINASISWDADLVQSDPANVTSPGVTTTVDNTLLIYAAGADWEGESGTNTFNPPDGFTLLTSFGDRGPLTDATKNWDWTSQMVASKVFPMAGETGMLMASMAAVNSANTSTRIMGEGWDVLLAIAPAPAP